MPRTSDPTSRQREILEWVKDFIHDHGMPPTVREIGGAFGIKSSSVFDLLKALEKKGYLRRGDLGARSLIIENRSNRIRHRFPEIRVLSRVRDSEMEGREADLAAIPIVGTVPAGRPILADENVIGKVLVDADVICGGRFFALNVKGDSMTGAGIQDSDIAIVRQQPLAESGDIVVAILDGEATVKRLYLHENHVELRPENPKHRPIPVHPGDDLRIAGKVVAVRRSKEMSE